MSLHKVDFMIIGVQKCGTTSLSHILSQHPQIDFCLQKEPSFFSKNNDWEKDLDLYHRLYPKHISGQLWGEASTSYSWLLEYPMVPERLFSYNPDLKLIYIMRDPIKRIISHYKYHRLKAYTTKDFEEEVIENPTYISHSMYAAQIKPFINLFSKDRILFLTLEDFISNPDIELDRISNFLNLNSSQFNSIDKTPQNVTADLKNIRKIKYYLSPFSSYIPSRLKILFKNMLYYREEIKVNISPEFKLYLRKKLKDDIKEIKNICTLDINNW